MLAAALVGARLWHYAAVLGLFGATVFPLYSAGERLGAWIVRVQRFGAVSALISGILWLALATASMAGSQAAALDPAMLGSVVTDTEFGKVWALRLGLAAVLAALSMAARPPRALMVAGATILLGSLGLVGHAAAMGLEQGWPHCLVDGFHLLAAGVWIGALMGLGVLLKSGPREVAARALTGFAGAGSAAVAILVATGLANAWMTLGEVQAVLASGYGWLLLAKVGLFALMLAAAAANRFWLAPRLAGGEGGVNALRATVGLEQGLAFSVLVIVAVLGVLNPHGG